MQLSRAAFIQNKVTTKMNSVIQNSYIFPHNNSCEHVSYSDIHVYIRSIINNFNLPRAFAWCGALPSDCEIYTALHFQ